mmetsp:Transcript_63801/g.190109  ORF Transcript_63801/g.190109 Transcript_63801/m.190109 type:complete len:384 (-) Transcript_63801:1-1152(-)
MVVPVQIGHGRGGLCVQVHGFLRGAVARLVRALALAEILVLPVGLAAQHAAVGGGAGTVKLTAVLLLAGLFPCLVLVHVDLHLGPLRGLVSCFFIGIVKGLPGILCSLLGGRMSIVGGLQLSVPCLSGALRLLRQCGLGLLGDSLVLLPGCLLLVLGRTAQRCLCVLQGRVLFAGGLRGLVQCRLRLCKLLSGGPQLGSSSLQRRPSNLEAALAAVHPPLRGLRLDFDLIFIALVNSCRSSAHAVVLGLGDTSTACLAACAIGPVLSATLLVGRDRCALALCRVQPGNCRRLGPRPGRPWPRSDGQAARSGKREGGGKRHTPVVPLSAQAAALSQHPRGNRRLLGLLGLRQPLQKQGLCLRVAKHRAMLSCSKTTTAGRWLGS